MINFIVHHSFTYIEGRLLVFPATLMRPRYQPVELSQLASIFNLTANARCREQGQGLLQRANMRNRTPGRQAVSFCGSRPRVCLTAVLLALNVLVDSSQR